MSGQMGMTAGLGLNPGGRPRPAVLPNPMAQYIQRTQPTALTQLASQQQQLQAQALRNQSPAVLAQPQLSRPQTVMPQQMMMPQVVPQLQMMPQPQQLPQPQVVPGPIAPYPIKYMAPGYGPMRDAFASTPRSGWTFGPGAQIGTIKRG